MEKFAVKLPDGRELFGASYPIPSPKKHMLIQTGMQEKATRYEKFAEFLNGLGFDVYVLDAFGQGFNAEKEEDLQKWPANAFFDNVLALNIKIEELKKDGLPTYIMGHSMGSFMVQSYLERFPNTVEKAIIMGSNGPDKMLYDMANFLASIAVNKNNWDDPNSFMSSLAMGGYAKAVENRKTDLDWLSYNEENVQTYIADPYCGHPNTGGFWREFLKGMKTLYQKENLAKISKNEHILIVSGVDDPVGKMGKGPTALEKMYKDLGVADVTLHLYDHMRHEILNEKDNQKVLDDIKEFLEK